MTQEPVLVCGPRVGDLLLQGINPLAVVVPAVCQLFLSNHPPRQASSQPSLAVTFDGSTSLPLSQQSSQLYCDEIPLFAIMQIHLNSFEILVPKFLPFSFYRIFHFLKEIFLQKAVRGNHGD